MSVDKTVQLAAKLLRLSVDEAREYSCDTDNPELTYYSVPIKGGDSLIVSNQGEVLYANSSVSYEKHMQAFKEGIRTPLEAFEAYSG